MNRDITNLDTQSQSNKQIERYRTPDAKEVDYAYPTSTTAKRFGFGARGCYYVRVLHRGVPFGKTDDRDRGYATKDEAFAYAETLPMDYYRYSMQPDE